MCFESGIPTGFDIGCRDSLCSSQRDGFFHAARPSDAKSFTRLGRFQSIRVGQGTVDKGTCPEPKLRQECRDLSLFCFLSSFEREAAQALFFISFFGGKNYFVFFYVYKRGAQ
jgi:hypothetical protein